MTNEELEKRIIGAGAHRSDRTPVLSIWGAHDPIVPPENVDVLNRALPKTRSVLLDSGHFVWEDRAEDYAAAILDWIRRLQSRLTTRAKPVPVQESGALFAAVVA